MNNLSRNILLWGIILVLIIGFFNVFMGEDTTKSGQSIAFSEFISQVENGKISDVTIKSNYISGHTSTGSSFFTYAPDDSNFVDKLLENKVVITASPLDKGVSFISLLINWLPFIVLIGLYFFFMRQMQGGGGRAMGFGKSRARMLTKKSGLVTFEDVAGVNEAKEELEEIVEFLRDPQKFQRLGGRIPKGVLLVGPPGTGKTLIARAVSGEANVPFFTISGSDFVEMFVGVGASRVRDMFEQAKKNSPCIIFIDEIDAVGRHRGAGLGGGNDEREQTLNQLLVEMDGFESNEGVILIAASNRPDILDPALLRPGRFDRQISVPNPDIAGREKILQVHLKKIKCAPNVDSRIIARGTPGFSGADLANLVNEGALFAARFNKRVVSLEDLDAARDKVMMGAERKSAVLDDQTKKITAYHEAGHALVSVKVEGNDPIHKATIIPRGRALGMVQVLPEKDVLNFTRQQLYGRLAMSMGGRASEEITFGYKNVTSGAQSDIQQATRMARAAVTRWGFSDELGPLEYGENQDEVFLGHSVSRGQTISEKTSEKIDQEVHRLVIGGYDKALSVLKEHHDQLVLLAESLLEYETLTGSEITRLLETGKIDRSPTESAFENKNYRFGAGSRSSVPTSRAYEGAFQDVLESDRKKSEKSSPKPEEEDKDTDKDTDTNKDTNKDKDKDTES